MEKRTLLAIILSLAVIIGYQYFFAPQPPPPKEQPPAVTDTARPVVETPSGAVAVSPPRIDIPVAGEKEIRVQNELYSAVLTSRGASIKRWELKLYKDKDDKNVVLLRNTGEVPAVGIGSNREFDLSRLTYEVSGHSLTLDSGNPQGTITFEYAGEGFSIMRTYTFYAGTYKVDLADEIRGLTEYWITVGSDFGIFEKDASYTHVGPALLSGADLEELAPKKLKEPKTFRTDLKWIAQEDKYFFAALAPLTAVEEARAWIYDDSPLIAFRGATGVNRFILYAGPKESERLQKLNVGLEHIIDYGFFSPISRPLFWILKKFYALVGNYGWAIILLTIVTRIPFIPLTNKGQKSMKKLQAIQPKMAEIKEKYKKDPAKMQKEMTELYKKHKVNPLGGCLPMLVQIPVFFALYKLLLVSIELRGAPFILWITDLSAPDTLFGHLAGFSLGGPLPYLMGVTMFIQQKMTPSGMDPRQAKIMLMLPIVFTFLFLNFASGLVLYWLVNNILGIIQQFFTNRKVAREETA